jgi:hypothetical protein
MAKKFILTFYGNKAELHEQLKRWSKENGMTMNGAIIHFIEKGVKKSSK